MGMDVYGRAPKSPKGEYFRSNIWGWPGIIDAIAETGVLPDDLVDAMCYNDGAGPDEAQAIALADALDEKLALLPTTGTFISEDSQYSKMGTATIAREISKVIPGELTVVGRDTNSLDFSTNIELLREFAEFCRESGGFNVW